jgi:hypothetical protein
VEVGDFYQGDFNGRRALRASVHPLMCLSDVGEFPQALASTYMKAAEALLLSPGDFEAETASGNVVEIYRPEKEEAGDQG